MEANAQKMKAVFAITERAPGKSFWTRVGVGFTNQDGSITLRLDAIPISGTLQVRDFEARDADRERRPDDPNAAAIARGRTNPAPRRDAFAETLV